MPKRKSKSAEPEKLPSLGRHATFCKVCSHPQREEIERQWVSWGNSTRIARSYKLSADSLYRHAHALGLFEKRARNIRKALERLIEHAESVEVTAPAVVSAIQAYAKINAQGQWIDRTESVSLNELFERMTNAELEAYAKDGKLPDWFTGTVGAAAQESPSEAPES